LDYGSGIIQRSLSKEPINFRKKKDDPKNKKVLLNVSPQIYLVIPDGEITTTGIEW